ncbi:MAG: YggU family protein [Euryarchaeota archaeon]|nr:YggU family protein [Euryarchaeota archaeon]
MFIQKRLDGSLILDVEISPNSETSRISGVNEWRKRLRIDISKPAVNGMANEELLRFIIQKFNIKSNQAELISGHKSKQKSIMVSGISDTDILSVVNQEVL